MIRFLAELFCVAFIILGGIGTLYVIDKLAPPVLMFLVRIGL